MPRPKLLIIVLFQNLGDERPFFAQAPAPPLSGALLAGLTPPLVEIELLHEMIRPIDYETDADFVALSFMDFCAPHAFEVARRFRARGRKVIAGGRYPSTFPDACRPHFDAVVVGEAERIWPRVVQDLVAGRLRRLYQAPPSPALDGIPPPRYDLVEPGYSVPVVTEATRGCPFRCSYCQLNIRPQAYRKRPIDDVLVDLGATDRLPWTKRKVAMLYDNNLGGDMRYAKTLLREIAGLGLWALGVQFSLNCLEDEEFVDLLARANCRMAFVGMESLHEPSLAAVNKGHNRVRLYRELFGKLKERGILTFAGAMVGLDGDTPEYYRQLPAKLEQVDPSAIFLSMSIPIPGTPFHREVEKEGRIVDRDLAHYDGDHLVTEPRGVTPAQVFDVFEGLNRRFYSWRKAGGRWGRLMASFLGHRDFPRRLGAAALISLILLRLTRFQRDHARRRVYPLVEEARARALAARRDEREPERSVGAAGRDEREPVRSAIAAGSGG